MPNGPKNEFQVDVNRSWFAQAVLTSIAADRGTQGHDTHREPHGGWQCVPAPWPLRLMGRRRRDKAGMWSLVQSIALMVACAFILWPDPSCAQDRCTDGRTASGQCVNAPLAHGARQAAIIFSQPKISQTAFPVLPSADATYRYPNQLIPDPLKPASTGIPAGN
jgi:hypothetical protein